MKLRWTFSISETSPLFYGDQICEQYFSSDLTHRLKILRRIETSLILNTLTIKLEDLDASLAIS